MSPQQQMVQQQMSLQQQQQGMGMGMGMGQGGDVVDELRRAVSPPNGRAGGGGGGKAMMNGNGNVNGMGNGKGKAPMRPDGAGEGGYESSGGERERENVVRERMVSPDQGRAASPTVVRAVSPSGGQGQGQGQQGQGQPQNMASVIMSRSETRSASPLVRQQQQQQQQSDTASSSPNHSPVSANGFVNSHGGQGHGHGKSQDVMRDLRAKEVEIEGMRKREEWMRAALAKAAKSGFVYVDGDGDEDEEQDGQEGGRGKREPRVAEVVVNLKQLRAKLQVRFLFFLLRVFVCALDRFLNVFYFFES